MDMSPRLLARGSDDMGLPTCIRSLPATLLRSRVVSQEQQCPHHRHSSDRGQLPRYALHEPHRSEMAAASAIDVRDRLADVFGRAGRRFVGEAGVAASAVSGLTVRVRLGGVLYAYAVYTKRVVRRAARVSVWTTVRRERSIRTRDSCCFGLDT